LRYWQARGFPYFQLESSEKSNEYRRLVDVDSKGILLETEIQMSTVGLRLANAFHPQMWGVRVGVCRSPMECFNNENALRRSLRKALQIWPHRYSVNENNLRRMLKTFSKTAGVSNFRPTVAKAIYEKYSVDGDCVIDFSAGYGGRLLGCMPLNRHYIGMDPCRRQIRGLRKMKTTLEKLVDIKAKVELYQACAEDLLPEIEEKSATLVFSSPPYFNHERYSTEKTQSYLRFPEYNDWLRGFLGKVLEESHRILKNHGYLIINVADLKKYNIAQDTLNLASLHFTLVEKLKLRLGHLPYLREQKMDAYKYEPVFVFKKQ
jgi:SAM-dependent methyltransferase